MTRVHSKAMNKSISTNRIIAHIEGHSKGATMVFFAGIHGNETAGVFALDEVLKAITPDMVNGHIYGISGNLQALHKNLRYVDKDLNRLWTKTQLKSLQYKNDYNIEEQEQKELFLLLEHIISTHSGPFYFIDFHTTSSKTLPFITINDALINRKFSRLFPVPIVLGIEEYLDGPLLSYINELGYVSLGFESGRHDDKQSIENCTYFIHLALAYANIIPKDTQAKFQEHYHKLKFNANSLSEVFEVTHLHRIKHDEVFAMKPGFKSFQKIKKGTTIATSNTININWWCNAWLFMPLYQSKGEEGFFMIKPINPIFLKLSSVLRRLRFDNILVLCPGVSWESKTKEALKVNLKVAKFLAKPLFHLLGYRNKTISANHLLLYNRERASKVESYYNQPWY